MHCLRRNWSRILHRVVLSQSQTRCHSMGAAEIRRVFIDYFKARDHKLIRASPVIPRKDKTLAFVNAGMNQFKPIFTGEETAPWPRAVNSQKCVRVGGKHNDLSDVGVDGYHHTFFEMLGSWSFGDYFKREACEMAWRLLTEEYGINPTHLYATYYAGDPALGLPPDHECRDIWREIGLPPERVLPFRSDNFWEMGPVGPCGPCTELHYDHHQRPGGAAADRVNAGHSDVTELWNLVFMQYQRHDDGSLTSLPERHVDTGMGLERLAAVLQRVPDNYSTDLFTPLFSTIYRTSPAPGYGGRYGPADATGLDAAYRTLADHARMVTVTLADGAVPADNHKLRRVLRRALHLCDNTFYSPRLLSALADRVAELLGPAFPELNLQIRNIQAALAAEREAWLASVSAAAAERRRCASELPELSQLSIGPAESPGLSDGLRELRRRLPPGRRELDGPLALRLHSQFGMTEEVLQEVALVRGLQFDVGAFQACLDEVRADSRQAAPVSPHLPAALLLRRLGLPSTDDAAKYEYTRRPSGEYDLPAIEGRVLAVLVDGEPATATVGERCSVVLDRTCFYSEGGGQAGDRGVLRWSGGEMNVEDTQQCRGYTLHTGIITSGRLAEGGTVTCELDPAWRLGCMRHHTATHLLNAALQRVMIATAQTASAVDGEHLRLEVASYQGAITPEQIAECDRLVQAWISAALPVSTSSESLESALRRPGLTLLAGEVYPDPVRLVSIPDVSCEPCCGAHLLNTADLRAFRVTGQRAAGLGARALRAVAGPAAEEAERAGERARQATERLAKGEMTPAEARPLAEAAPYVEKTRLIKEIDRLGDADKAKQKGKEVATMERELAALERSTPAGRCVVHHFSGRRPYSVPAPRLLRRRPLPTAIVYHSRGVLSVRCVVPEHQQASGAGPVSAADWLADLTGDVPSEPVFMSDPARMAGLDIAGPMSREQETQLVDRMLQLLRERAAVS